MKSHCQILCINDVKAGKEDAGGWMRRLLSGVEVGGCDDGSGSDS
jgi:hypothetical protein